MLNLESQSIPVMLGGVLIYKTLPNLCPINKELQSIIFSLIIARPAWVSHELRLGNSWGLLLFSKVWLFTLKLFLYAQSFIYYLLHNICSLHVKQSLSVKQVYVIWDGEVIELYMHLTDENFDRTTFVIKNFFPKLNFQAFRRTLWNSSLWSNHCASHHLW